MSEVFDLDAAAASKAAARDEKPPFEFTFDGETYTTISPNKLDPRVIDESLTRDPAGQLFMVLGSEQWERLEASPAEFTADHLEALLEAWYTHHGLSEGKSGGSRRPSTRRAVT